MQHPVDLARLPESARRALGAPANVKMMAARGMAPMPPAMLLCVLYGLAYDADAPLREAAAKTLAALPEPVLQGALGSADLPGFVLDDLALRNAARPEVLARILRHPATLGETAVALAKTADEATAEVIATNEARLLETPAIIEALYLNRHTRMSTSDRIVEFAARNGLAVSIPGFANIVAALRDQLVPAFSDEALESDKLFSEALVEAEDAGLDELDEADDGTVKLKEKGKKVEKTLTEMSITEQIRTAMLGSGMQRALLIRSRNRLVSGAVLDSPKLGDDEVVKIAQSRMVSEDVLRRMCSRGPWLRFYEVKWHLVNNPKTPVGEAIKLLPHIRENDLKKLLGNKNINAGLRQAAQNFAKRK